jgi:cell wall-associated NlpC family hydrolase
MLTTALIESGGNPRAVGDSGSSFGLFQLHKGGRLTAAGLTPEQAYDPYTNARASAREFRTFQDRGLTGAELAYSAQRPADRAGYIAKYNQTLAKAQRLLAGRGGATTPAQPSVTRPAAQPSAPNPKAPAMIDEREASLRGQFAALMAGGKVRPIDILTGGMRARDEASAANAQRAAELAYEASEVQQETKPVSPTTPASQGGANPPSPNAKGAQAATSFALNNLGIPYSWGGGTPSGPTEGFGRGKGTVGYDCSAFVQAALARAGVKVPRVTYDQMKVGKPVANLANAQPGDMLFPSAGHVMLYLGNGKAAEAARTGTLTRVSDVTGRQFVSIRRVL